MQFAILSSGSKGNATLVYHKNTLILIDMGISLTRLKEGLSSIGKTIQDINYVLITHNHTDHISGLKFLSTKKVYSLEGNVPPLCNKIESNKEYKMNDFTVCAYKTNHDAINPCGFFLKTEKDSLAYFTDTGIFPEQIIPFIKNPTYLILESNHDISMEMKTNRPMVLKERILGDRGHLCNEDSAIAASKIIGDNTREVILAHLSEEANDPEIALLAYKKIFDYFNIDVAKLRITCAKQYETVFGGDQQ